MPIYAIDLTVRIPYDDTSEACEGKSQAMLESKFKIRPETSYDGIIEKGQALVFGKSTKNGYKEVRFEVTDVEHRPLQNITVINALYQREKYPYIEEHHQAAQKTLDSILDILNLGRI